MNRQARGSEQTFRTLAVSCQWWRVQVPARLLITRSDFKNEWSVAKVSALACLWALSNRTLRKWKNRRRSSLPIFFFGVELSCVGYMQVSDAGLVIIIQSRAESGGAAVVNINSRMSSSSFLYTQCVFGLWTSACSWLSLKVEVGVCYKTNEVNKFISGCLQVMKRSIVVSVFLSYLFLNIVQS